MSKKSRNTEGRKPKHHLFNNKILNDILCPTEECSREFAEHAISTLVDTIRRHDAQNDSVKMRRLFIAYVCAHVETSFELGWKEAILRSSK